ncbi:MAG: methyltransferase domain-containing protein [Candidatus Zixiibacteriota bacterium]|nr:MAG: methyltransferase domain-containing protein [candidate division Zixibacteria bacterium]
MTENHKPVDWGDDHYRHMLTAMRKYLWRDDTLKMIAAWLNLKPGMTAVDVGCGLGHLGYSFWPFFGKGGTYIGVDISPRLLDDAQKAAREWVKDGTAYFLNGNATNLPVADNSADMAMGQTLLMHLADPVKGLSEMVRVTKPGGLILSIETDLLSSALNKPCSSLPPLSIEERLLTFNIHLHCHKGRIELGRGDSNTGVMVPHLMYEQGLTDIDARLAENTFVLHPPYDSEIMQHRLNSIRNQHLDPDQTSFLDDKLREEFLAGGGNPSDFDRYMQIHDRARKLTAEQIDKGEFYMVGSSDVYIVKARKPM